MFTIMFICTGNRCRSPYAHSYFALRTSDLPVEVLSSGTLDAPDQRVPDELVTIGQSSGLDLSTHRSKVLAEQDLSEIDLLIGFERNHIASAVVDADFPAERAFTLPEIVRLLRGVDISPREDVVERARAAVQAASEARNSNPTFVPGEEVADPFRRSTEVYQASADEIAALCNELYTGLFGDIQP
jgi:protein-tyrosine phosphatase